MRGLIKRLFPDHTALGSLIRRIAVTLGFAHQLPFEKTYDAYIADTEPGLFLPAVGDDSGTPGISIVVPFFNTPDRYLTPLLDSILDQTYPHWELIMADASTDIQCSERIREAASRDDRFVYIRLDRNGGISSNTNEGLRRASSPYVAFVDHDDLLDRHALNEVAAVIASDPDVDVLYSDEDVISENGLHRKRPSFKPDWAPHTFLETNYTSHLSVIRRSLIADVGGLRPEMDGSQDYDLLLRIHGLPQVIHVRHVPKILYHWREAPGSTAVEFNAKPHALDAGRRALDEYMAAKGVEAENTAVVADRPGLFHVRPRWKATVNVLIELVSFSDSESLVASLKEKTTCRWVTPRFAAVHDGQAEAFLAQHPCDAVVRVTLPFLPADETWLDELIGVLALPDTRKVAPLLLTVGGVVISAGRITSLNGSLDDLYRGWKVTQIGPLGHVDLVRDVDGLHPAVVASRTNDVSLNDEGHGEGAIASPDQRLVVWGHQRFIEQTGLGSSSQMGDSQRWDASQIGMIS